MHGSDSPHTVARRGTAACPRARRARPRAFQVPPVEGCVVGWCAVRTAPPSTTVAGDAQLFAQARNLACRPPLNARAEQPNDAVERIAGQKRLERRGLSNAGRQYQPEESDEGQ